MAEIKDNPVINSIAQAGQAQAASQNTALAIHEQLDQEDAASSAAQIARTAMGGAEATMSNEKNSWQAATDAKVAQTRADLGSDPTLQGSLSNQWLQRMNENAQKAYDSLDVIQQKQSKTLLSDPLGFINAQFTLPADIATHDYYARKANVAEEQLNQITASSDANVIAINRAQQHTSTEFALAESDKAVQGAVFDNARLKSENAGRTIAGLNDLDNLTNKQLNIAFQVHAAQNSDAQLEETKKLHTDNLALRQERLDQKADSDAALELDRQAYNMGQKRIGNPTIDDPKVWRAIYTRGYNRDPNFMNTLGIGQSLQANGGVTNGVAVGSSAGESALLYSASASNMKDNPVGSFLRDQVTAVKSLPGAPKDHTQLISAISDRAANEAKLQMANIDPSKGNIYSAPPPAVIVKARGLDGDPFLDSVVKPLISQDPTTTINDDVMVGKAFDFAKSGGQGDIETAANGIAQYYKMAVLKNNLLNQYSENNLPSQVGYNAKINRATINLTDPIAVKRAIIQHNIPRFDSPFGAR